MTEMLPQGDQDLPGFSPVPAKVSPVSLNQEATESGPLVLQQINIWLKPLSRYRASGWLNLDLHREPFSWQEGRGGWPLRNQAFICPWCLDQWAVIRVDQRGFQLEPVSCVICDKPSDFHPVPGSILDISGTGAIDTLLLAQMPEPLLRLEFDLHLRTFPCTP